MRSGHCFRDFLPRHPSVHLLLAYDQHVQGQNKGVFDGVMAVPMPSGVDSRAERQDLTCWTGTVDTMGSTALDIRSLFFDLSPEMRNQIYFDVLVDGEVGVEVDCENIFNKTSLLRVCSQIRNECLKIFYTQNCFVLSNTPSQTT